jgi:hypothetical protein
MVLESAGLLHFSETEKNPVVGKALVLPCFGEKFSSRGHKRTSELVTRVVVETAIQCSKMMKSTSRLHFIAISFVSLAIGLFDHVVVVNGQTILTVEEQDPSFALNGQVAYVNDGNLAGAYVATATNGQGTATIVNVPQWTCEIETCQNGLWNRAECKCECIPPYCVDQLGDCTIPSNNCGGNPWAGCTRDFTMLGGDCPWYPNLMDPQGDCTTGSDVSFIYIPSIITGDLDSSFMLLYYPRFIVSQKHLFHLVCQINTAYIINIDSGWHVDIISRQGNMLQITFPRLDSMYAPHWTRGTVENTHDHA